MKSGEDPTGPQVPDRSGLGIFPVSFNQERAILSRLAAKRQSVQAPTNIIGIGFRIHDDINIGRLRSAIEEIAWRHSALRLRFSDNLLVPPPERERRLQRFLRTGIFDGSLHMQSVVESGEVGISEVDLSGQDPREQDSAVRRLTRDEGLCRFEDSESPRIRGTLIKTREGERLLVLFVDHLVSDGFSTQVIGRELRCLLAGQTLERPRTSFTAFVAWQLQALHSSYFDRSIRYWREQWARFASARIAIQEISFAIKNPERKLRHDFGAEVEVLGIVESEEIRSFARQSGKTIFMIWVAVVAVVLSQYTGKLAVAIWAHFANRVRPGTEDAIGFFNNSHILGIELTAEATVLELLDSVKGVVTEALRNQELPLPYLWYALNCKPRFSDAAVLVDFMRRPQHRSDDPILGTQISPAVLPTDAPRFSPLGIYVFDNCEYMTLSSQYQRDWFDASGVRRFLKDVKEFALRFARDPGAKVLSRGAEGRRASKFHSSDPSGMGEFIVVRSDLIPEAPQKRNTKAEPLGAGYIE